jgi:uncharacterized membrane protein
MRSSRSRSRALAATAAVALVTIAGIAYPFSIYFFGDRVKPAVFVAGALVLIGLQLTVLRSPVAKLWRVPLLLSAVLTIVVAFLDQNLAKEAYPVVRSLAVALVFGWSLVSPPSLIERFARLRHPELPPQATRYCRNVTVIWTIWLTVNGVIAAALAVWGDVKSWAIWTGAISYAISGLLFLGEFGYRSLFLERRARP